MTAAGWYQAEGDPPGTTRYWDGERWVGDPVVTPVAGAPSGVGSQPGGAGPDGFQSGPGAIRQLASPGARIGARLIDVLIGLVLALVLFAPVIAGLIDDFSALGPDPTDSEIERIFTDRFEGAAGRIAVLSLISVVWDFLWVGMLGATPGKLMLGLRVADANTAATPPGWAKAALRSLNRVVGFIPVVGSLVGGLVALASFVMLFADDQHRTVMDRVATTVVIKK